MKRQGVFVATHAMHSDVQIACFFGSHRVVRVQRSKRDASLQWGFIACSEAQKASTVFSQYQATTIRTADAEYYSGIYMIAISKDLQVLQGTNVMHVMHEDIWYNLYRMIRRFMSAHTQERRSLRANIHKNLACFFFQTKKCHPGSKIEPEK